MFLFTENYSSPNRRSEAFLLGYLLHLRCDGWSSGTLYIAILTKSYNWTTQIGATYMNIISANTVVICGW